MSAPKHSPIPWKACPDSREVTAADGNTVCELGSWCGPLADPFAEGDLSLIAAAPDLYAALKDLLHVSKVFGAAPEEIQASRDALAKAEGRS